jgi:Mg2+ and Co2+ transporter CorA
MTAESRRYCEGTIQPSQNWRYTMIYVILAVIFVVLLFAYMRVRSRRLSR